MESLRQRVHQLEEQLIEKQARERRFAEFSKIDTVFVSSLSDRDLAGWQALYPTDSPQFIIANHEWQRRLNLEQIKANRYTAYIGLLGVVLGVVLTSLFTYVYNSHINDMAEKQKPATVIQSNKEPEVKLNNSQPKNAGKAVPVV